jgi:hypothetical protein
MVKVVTAVVVLLIALLQVYKAVADQAAEAAYLIISHLLLTE